MVHAKDGRSCDDSGAVLILALMFIIVGALSLTAIVTFAGTALRNTANLKAQRGLEYAGDSATDVAIQAVRYSSHAYDQATGRMSTPPQTCLGTASIAISATGHPTAATAQKFTMAVDCQGSARSPFTHTGPAAAGSVSGKTATTATLFSGTPTRFVGYEIVDSLHAIPSTTFIVPGGGIGSAMLSQSAGTKSGDTLTVVPTVERTVTFFACVRNAPATPICSKSNFDVRATVGFNDVSSTGSFTCPSVPGPTATCGTSISVKQWLVNIANH